MILKDKNIQDIIPTWLTGPVDSNFNERFLASRDKTAYCLFYKTPKAFGALFGLVYCTESTQFHIQNFN